MPTTEQPEISVVMPVYNAAAYLSEAVDSVLQQTCTNWELIAVDDGSSDESLRILREYAAHDNRIRPLAMSHGGIAATRNAGIEAARGEFIAALDNDDAMCPQRLELQVAFLKEHETYVAVGAAVLYVDIDGDPIREEQFPAASEDIESELLEGRNPLIQSNVMFRRNALLKVNGYRDACNFSEDFDLFLRLSEIGLMGNLDVVLLRQRQHVSRASASHYEDQHRAVLLALKEAYERRGLSRELPEIESAWHPTSQSDYHIRCASDAWDAGNIAAVKKHAVRLWAHNPFSIRALELYSRTLMGPRIYGLFAGVKSLLRPARKLTGGRP